jgi:hypothetical protein
VELLIFAGRSLITTLKKRVRGIKPCGTQKMKKKENKTFLRYEGMKI